MKKSFLKAFCLLVVPCAISWLQASDVNVTPANMGPWAFDTTDPNGTSCSAAGNTCAGGEVAQMTPGPGTPPLGTGSAELQLPNGHGDEGALIADSGLDGVAITSLTALSYSAYDSANNGSQFPYLALKISFDGGLTLFDTLFFEPPYQSSGNGAANCASQAVTAMNQWQSWNALSGCWWNNNGPSNGGTNTDTLDDILMEDASAAGKTVADATIMQNPTNGDGGLSLRVGYADPGFAYDGFVDNVTIGINGVNTTYNFDPTPEPRTLALIGLGLVAIALWKRRAIA